MGRLKIDIYEYVPGAVKVKVYGREKYFNHYKSLLKKLGFEVYDDKATKLIRDKDMDWYENMIEYVNDKIDKAEKSKMPFINVSTMEKEIGVMNRESLEILRDKLKVEYDENSVYILSEEEETTIYQTYKRLFKEMGFNTTSEEASKQMDDEDQIELVAKIVKYINDKNYKVVDRPKITIDKIRKRFPEFIIDEVVQTLKVKDIDDRYINVVMDVTILTPQEGMKFTIDGESYKFGKLKSTPDKVPYCLELVRDKQIYRCYRNVNAFYYEKKKVMYQ